MDKEDENVSKEEESQQQDKAPAVSKSSDNANEDVSPKEKKQGVSVPLLIQHNGFQFPGVPASPPKFISVEQIMQASDVFSNMALAHEIAVNKEFVLEKAADESSLHKQVKEVVHKAFWDVFEAQLKDDPPNYSHALLLLAEIKEALMGILLPHQTRLRSQIDEVLDLELIKQQVENDALDFHYYAKFIVSMMSRLCAPVRDEKIEDLMSLTDVVPLYKGILETLDLMKLDMANFTLQQIRPHIQQHSVEYEQKKFQEFLSALNALTPPVDGLELTKKWLGNVYKKLQSARKSQEPCASAAVCEILTSDVVIKAFLELFEWNNDVLFPETLQMDQVRYVALREQLVVIILSASILFVTYSIVGQSIQGITSLKEQLKDQLFVLLKDVTSNSPEEVRNLLESIGLQVLKEINCCLEKHGYSNLDENKSRLISEQIKEVQSVNHGVRKLIQTRVLEFLEEVLKSPNAASVKFPIGLSAFYKELSSLAGQFLQLVNHNRAVFSDYYADIVTNIRQQEEV